MLRSTSKGQRREFFLPSLVRLPTRYNSRAARVTAFTELQGVGPAYLCRVSEVQMTVESQLSPAAVKLSGYGPVEGDAR